MRFRARFDELEACCLFVGYPRSGHSLIGAMINAHPDAVLSHELTLPTYVERGCSREWLISCIIEREAHFRVNKNNFSYYDYTIPGTLQGRFNRLRVVGDKRGGHVVRHVIEHPDFFQRFEERTKVPLRLIHVVRNPFDNITAIAAREKRSLDDAIDYYFQHVDYMEDLIGRTTPERLLTLWHEQTIADPMAAIRRLCDFLSLPFNEAHAKACVTVVYDRPATRRSEPKWSNAQRTLVEKRAATVSFLSDYKF